MITIHDYPVTPIASSIDIIYTPHGEDGFCEVLVKFYDGNNAQISHMDTTLTGTQLQYVLDGDTNLADDFVLQRFGIERI